MERLTKTITIPQRKMIVYTKGKYEDSNGEVMEYQDIQKVLKRLASYEDTDLTPKQIHKMKEALSCENTPESTRSSRDNDGWVPVEERMPEASLESVIGWDDYRKRCCFVQYYNGRWILGNGIEPVKIVAWRPRPEDYLPERGDNHDI